MKAINGKSYITRLVLVSVLTGFSQIVSLISVGYLKKLDQILVYEIGNYESLIVIFTAIISLGLQVITVRDIAISKKWEQILIDSQRDRFSFSIIILLTVLFFDIWFNSLDIENFIFYLVIPLIALNSDYSFYGKGEPIKGAFLSFLRVSVLSMFIILSVIFDNPYVRFSFIVTVISTYLLVGLIASKFNKLDYFVKPRIGFYKSYLDSFNVGIASFSLVFFGLGIVSYSSLFYTEEAVANAYLMLKIYVFYVGIKRLIVQIIFKELTNEKLIEGIDKIGVVIGLTVILILIYYPQYSIKFFVKDYAKSVQNLHYLLPAIFFTSFSISSSVNLLLKLKDRIYSLGFILGALLVLILIYFFSLYNPENEAYLYLSISIGELVVISLHGWGLNRLSFFKKRFIFTLIVLIILLLINTLLLMLEQKVISFILLIVVVLGYTLFNLKINSKHIGDKKL